MAIVRAFDYLASRFEIRAFADLDNWYLEAYRNNDLLPGKFLLKNDAGALDVGSKEVQKRIDEFEKQIKSGDC